MPELLDLDVALATAVGAAPRLEAETTPLLAAAGRVLAETIEADLDMPPFDTTAMDGWALAAAQTPADLRLRIAAVVAAGAEGEPPPPGSAVKLMTGAPLPEGFDAVVPVEEADEPGDGTVRLHTPPRAGAHVRPRGEVWTKGTPLLLPGRRLTAADIALVAAAGREHVAVTRRLRAGVLVTGDEVVAPSRVPAAAQIRNTNGPLLVAALSRLGAEATDLGIARDTRAELSAALSNALASGLDVLLTTGGVSAGDFDLVAPLLRELGAQVLFHRISLKPAKPLLVARCGATLVFALPGNPVSSAVAFDLFVRAVVRRANGMEPAIPEPVKVFLADSVRNRGPRVALHPAEAEPRDGRIVARPLPTRGSHDLLTHARATALLRLPPDSAFERGAAVAAYLSTPETTFG